MDFVLDYSKWRCGGYSIFSVGSGPTSLLNSEGYMCCLGQVSEQLGCSRTRMLNRGEPLDLADSYKRMPSKIDFLVRKDVDEHVRYNSNFSCDAMDINDGEYTTPQEKYNRLKDLFEKEGHTLSIINQPWSLD